MLTLILGDAGSGKTTAVADAVATMLAGGRRVFLIVPEQETVSCERMMAERLPAAAPLTFEVTNFTRLSDTVFRKTGGLAARAASAAAEQVLMWRTLVGLSPLLKTMTERPNIGTIERMRDVMAELRAARLDTAALRTAAQNVGDPALADKLADYALIAETYRALHGEAYTGTADRLDLLAEMLTRYRPLDGFALYVDGFSSFTEQQYAVLSALIEQTDVTVTLCLPENAPHQISAADALHTVERLTRIASERSVPLCKKVLEGRRRCRAAVTDFVATRLFRTDYESLAPWEGAPDDALRLVEAFDPMEASDFVASDILRRVGAGEARFCDFTVVCSSNAYRDVIDAALRKCGIPYFFSVRDTLLTAEPVKLILAALSIIAGDWRREDVIAYLKCPLSGIAPGDTDALALYTETWDIEGAGLRSDADWDMSPDGYGAPHTEGRKAYNRDFLARVNRTRRQYLPPLTALSEALLHDSGTPGRIRAITEFLLTLRLPEALDRRAEELRRAGDTVAAEDAARIWDVICDTFDTLTTLAGDTAMNLAEFTDLLKLLFRAVTLGQIPASTNEVTIADPATVRSGCVRHVYLLGATEGIFPKNVSEGRSFTETEREALLAAGVNATDATDLRAARELFAFYRALMLPSDTATVIWTRADTALRPTDPSEAVRRLRTLLGPHYPILIPSLSTTPEALVAPALARERLGQMAGTPLGAAAYAALGYGEWGVTPTYRNDTLSLSEAAAALQYPGDLHLSQTRIQSYKQCPLSDFCHYVVLLNEPERAAFRSDTAGTFVHAVLEQFLRLAAKYAMDYRRITPDDQKRLLDEVFPSVVAETLPEGEIRKPRVAHQLARLRRITAAIVSRICEDFAHTKFEPVFEELRIDDRNPETPTPYTIRADDGRYLRMYGVIDRVDAYRTEGNTYVRVVDYKTGNKIYNEKESVEKNDFQLLLYLSALLATDSPAFRREMGVAEGGSLLPGGAMYLASLAKDASTTAPPSQTARGREANASPVTESGYYFDPTHLKAAFDAPIGGKKSGGCAFKETEELAAMIETAETELRRTAAAMTGGVICAKPKPGDYGHCQYCSFRAVCRSAESEST